MNEETIFQEALSRSPAERAVFLEHACAGRPDLRAAVEALLAAHAKPGNVLDKPAIDLDQIVDSDVGAAHLQRTGEYTPAPEGTPSDPGTRDYHPQSELGLVVAGRYTLVQKIGEGGMGEVWVAKQTEPVKRKVALKLIKAGMDSKAVLARFEQERQALAMMDHPNIARVLDGGVTPTGQPFFVMELVNGLPLNKFCDELKLPARQRLELFVPICQAVQHAHQKGIVHRDLKPANILITMIDGKPVPKVIDFGVAKATAGKLTDESISTQFGAVVGTLEYMSPEQAGFAGEDVDTRADIYSLGVILYEMLTGLKPIDAKRLRKAAFTEMIRIIKEEEPSKPSTRLSTDESLPSLAANRQIEPKKLMALLRGELDWVVMKCLEKQRERRYETANALAREIQRYLADEAVEARPPSAGYRLKKFVTRNKGQVVAVGLVLLTLVGGIVGTTIGLFAANAAAENERTANAGAQVARTAAENAAKAEGEAKIEAQRAAAQEKTAREREEIQRAAAEKARDRTRDVLDAMTSSATGDSLSTQKVITEEQKKFLAEVLTYYREFAGEKADDAKSRFLIALAAFRVGQIEYRLGRMEQAIAAFQMARDGFRTLTADFPHPPGYRQNLASSHNELGTLLRQIGKLAEVQEQFQEAMAIQEKLVADFPDRPDYRRLLATTHNNLASLLNELGKKAAAEEQYRKALAINEKLAADVPTSADYRRMLAQSNRSLGDLLARQGQGAAAEDHYRKGLALLEKLVADFPTMPDYQNGLAAGYNGLAFRLAGSGKPAEAKGLLSKAIVLQEKLAADFPSLPDYRDNLVGGYNNLAWLLASQGQQVQAEELYRKALALQVKLAADFPTVIAYRRFLAASQNNLGGVLADQGKRAEAQEQFRNALAIREKLAAEFPAVPVYQIDLGGSYSNCGCLLFEGGRASESLGWLDKAIATLTPVHRAAPRDEEVKQALIESHRTRARAYDVLAKPVEAIKDWDRAIELSPLAGQPRLRASRATSQLEARLVAEALAEVTELTKTPFADARRSLKWNDEQWYVFACTYAVASDKFADKRQEYADRAMELLHTAVMAGFNNAAHMKKDPDLDPIRDREDFQTLLANLEKRPPPAK